MKRKRKSEENSSLELLLDTMCNTFGGIMFIAILLVILCSMNDFTKPNSEKNIKSKMTPQQVEELKAKVRLKKMRLDKALNKIKIPANMINSKELKLSIDYQRLKGQLAKTNIEKIILAYDLKDSIQEQQKIKQQNIIDSQTLRNEKRAIRKIKLENSKLKLKTKIAHNVASTNEITPPQEKNTNKIPTFAVVKSNRLYLLFKSSSINPVQINGFNKEAFSDSFQLFFSDDNKELRCIPKLGHGELINSDILIKKNIEKTYTLFPKTRYFIWFIVHADSIKSFIKIRKYLHRNKFEYTWQPYMSDANLRIYTVEEANYKSY